MNFGNEILSLQFGHYSNYIGAHWLNIQEAGFSFNPNFVPEINNDVLYKEGVSSQGESTYTPRLVLVDFKKSLGHLETSCDFEQVSETVNWDVQKIDNCMEANGHSSNEYLKDADALKSNDIPLLKSSYNLDNSVSTWSDYIIQPLHSRSINVINGYELGVNDNDFSSFSLGVTLWEDYYFQDDFVDKIRLYIEECDNLQGFHCLVDAHNGFSGLSSKCLEYVRDEYGKKSIFCVPSYSYNPKSEGNTQKQNIQYILNVLAGMSNYAEFSDLITPISCYSNLFSQPRLSRSYKNIIYKPDSLYHSSAIIAMALDTVTMPYRTRDPLDRMDDMIRALNIHGRSVVAIGTNFPFPMAKDSKLTTVLEEWENKWFESLTPEVNIDLDNVNVQLVNVRGIDNDSIHRDDTTRSDDSNSTSLCKTAGDMFNLFYQFSFDFIKTDVKSFKTAVRIPPTYPRIFNEDYNLTSDPDNPWGRLAEFRILASLHSTPDIKNLLQQILSPSRSKSVERLATNLGLIPTDYTEMLENIERLMSCYYDPDWTL